MEILGDALVGVVGPAAQLQLIVSPLSQPGVQVSAGQPAPPADLEHLTEVKAIDRHGNGEKHQNAEKAKLPEQLRAIESLERVVEGAIPLIDPHADVDIARG